MRSRVTARSGASTPSRCCPWRTGEPEIQELYDQTLGLLNFATVPHETFGRQIAFNALPWPDAGTTRTEIAALLDLDAAAVVTRSAWVPIFHGHAHSLTVTFDLPVRVDALREGLAGDGSIRVVDDPEAFSPVDLAGQDTVTVHALAADRAAPERVSLWCFCDNLKGGAALNAVRIMERVIELNQGAER